MARVSPYQGDFSTGEVSPELLGRTDSDRYKSALATCKNGFPTSQGAWIRRSGTRFVHEVKDSSAVTILVPFVFSESQAYVLEFGNQYMRVYTNYGRVETSPGVAFELVTPWKTADLSQLAWTQSADVLYMLHPSYKFRKIERFGNTDWRIATVEFNQGPYLDENEQGVTLQITSAGGKQSDGRFLVCLTAGPEFTVNSSADHVPGTGGVTRVTTTAAHGFYPGQQVGFSAGSLSGALYVGTVAVVDSLTLDFTRPGAYVNLNTYKVRPAPFSNNNNEMVGGMGIRFKNGSTWYDGQAALFFGSDYGVGGGLATYALFLTDPGSSGTSGNWRFGRYWGTDGNLQTGDPGYPTAIGFHQDRLFVGGSNDLPQAWDGSRTSDYENFSPTDPDGTVPADAAISGTLNEGGVDPIRWFSSDEQGLLIGTAGSEFWITASNLYEAISATNISIKKSTSFGSNSARAVQAGKATLFIQRAQRKIFEMAYFWQVAGFRSTNMSVLAYHITQGGLTQLAYQDQPHPVVWGVRSDGALIGLSYERDLDQVRAGWHQHVIGGYGTPSFGQSIVESIAVVPAPSGDRSDLWMIVNRYINGATKRYIEYMEKIFDDSVDLLDAFHVDCGLTYSSILSGAIIGKANPATVNYPAHGLSTGNKVRLRNVNGFTGIENAYSTITVVDADHFTLNTIDTSTQASPFSATADVYKMASTISGFSHLEGQTVSVLGDGAVYPDTTVTSGSITISQPCAVVSVGFGFPSDAKLVRLEAGAQNGTSIGKMRKVSNIRYMVNRSAAFKHGMSFDNLTQLTFRTGADVMGDAVPLFTGITENADIPGDYDRDGQICIRQDQPLPLTLLAVMPQQTVQDNQ